MLFGSSASLGAPFAAMLASRPIGAIFAPRTAFDIHVVAVLGPFLEQKDNHLFWCLFVVVC